MNEGLKSEEAKAERPLAGGEIDLRVEGRSHFGTTEAARNSILNTLSPKEHPLSLLGFSHTPEMKRLPGTTRVVRIDAPVQEYQRLVALIDQSDLARPLSMVPTLRNKREPVRTLQTLVTDKSSLDHLKERASGENLHLHFALSEASIPILQVNGAAGALSESLHENSGNGSGETQSGTVQSAIVPWPGVYPSPSQETIPGPRLGPCSYLVFDPNIFKVQTDENEKNLIAHLSMLSGSRDFSFSFDQAGNLVVMALNERAIGMLADWGSSLQRMVEPRGHLFLGKGEVVTSNRQDLELEGYLSDPELRQFRNVGKNFPWMYSTLEHLEVMKQSGRDETRVTLFPTDSIDGYVTLEVQKNTDFSVGGPDRLIGHKDEFEGLKNGFAPENPAKLIFVEGPAGSGKSRLILEATRGEKNVLKVSMDPAGRNIAGYSLVNLADQIAGFMQENMTENHEPPPSVKALLEFSRKPETEKLHEVNKYTDTIAYYCNSAVQFAEEIFGNMIVVLDDVHHIDRFSDGHIMNMVREIVESETSTSKFVFGRRPEKRYASLHQDNLQQRVSSVRTVSLMKGDGKPKLDFTDPEIVRDYILYSLPEYLRLNFETETPKALGEWADQLGSMAKSPFEMDSFLQEILSNAGKYLHIQKDRIDASAEGLRRIREIHGKDMVVYHLERIREQLKDDSLKVLQVFALIGHKVATEKELARFMNTAFGYPVARTRACLVDLTEKGYLIPAEKRGEGDMVASYAIWHENIRDILLTRTIDQKDLAELATKIAGVTKDSETISTNQRFTILHHAAIGKSQHDAEFWEEYAASANDSLETSKRSNLYGQGFATASLILNELETKQGESPDGVNGQNALVDALNDLAGGKEVPQIIARMIVDALLAVVENGYYYGQFSKVHKAIELAEQIHENSPGVDVPLASFYRIGFETAYVQINNRKLDYYFGHLQGPDQACDDDNGMKVMQLKYAFRKKDANQKRELNDERCRTIIAGFEEEGFVPPEVSRLQIRIDLQDIFIELKNIGIDGDAHLSGLDLTPEQRKRVQLLEEQIEILRDELSDAKNEDGTPKQLSPIDELALLDAESEINALLGKYGAAIQGFGEAWRVAMQMDIPKEAARSAKQKGDMEVIAAITRRSQGKLFYRQSLKGAVQTYTEDGINVAEKVNDDGFYKFLLVVQRLRATCLLLASYDNKEAHYQADEVAHYLEQAQGDFEFLNQAPWNSFIPDKITADTGRDDFETCYYITPYIHIYAAIREVLQKSAPDLDSHAYSSQIAADASALYHSSINPDKLGEQNRKMRGIALGTMYHKAKERR